jgi:hypothetical protein
MVRTTVPSQKQLDEIVSLGAEPMRCVIGPGVQEFCAPPAVVNRMREMGLSVVVLQPDMQALIDAERMRLLGPGNPAPRGQGDEGGLAGVPDWFLDFKTYPQFSAHLDDLVALRPDLASKITVGTTIEGRTIYALRITSPGGANKPAVLYTGCQHAREWAAAMSAMFIADSLVRDYGSDPAITSLVDRIEFFVIPVVNVDGFEFTYAPAPIGDRMWRKNRRDHGDGNFGVDLNRNWGVDWGGPNSTSSNTGSDLYFGSGPFSEPETAAVRDFIIARPRLVAHIDVHSYGQLVLQSWGYTNAENPHQDLIDDVGTRMNQGIFGTHGEFYENGWGGSLLYLASGVMPDWCHGDRGMLSYTIEVRDQGATGFILPPEQIVPCAQEVFSGALALADRSTIAAHFFAPRGMPKVLPQNQPQQVRIDIRNAPQFALDPATARVWWRVGSSGAFTASTLVPAIGVQYQATLPAIACGQRLEWYFEIDTTGPNPIATRWPADAPISTFGATAASSVLAYDFEATAGWTTAISGATAGTWARGVPANTPNWSYDPRHDADGTGTGACYVTGNSNNNDLDNGSVLLSSPVIDVTSLIQSGEQATVSYACFLHHVSPAGGDLLKVEASANGGTTWTQVAAHTSSAGANWRGAALSQSDLAALGVSLGSTFRLRFTATDGNPQSIVEAGVDDVRIWGDCRTASCPGDVNRDGAVDADDVVAVVVTWGACGPPTPPCPTDIAPPGGNGQVDADDLVAVILGWGPCP